MLIGKQRERSTLVAAFLNFLNDLLEPGHGVVERRIPCSGDGGRRVIVIEQHKVISYLTWTGPSPNLGTLTYRTDRGEPVEIDQDNLFIISSSRETLIPETDT